VDSGLGVGVALQLATWVGFFDDRPDGWALLDGDLCAGDTACDCFLDDGLEQAGLPPNPRVDRLDHHTRGVGDRRQRGPGVSAVKECVTGSGQDVLTVCAARYTTTW
jgi:hypothetical protein